jgi:hypothetical protein
MATVRNMLYVAHCYERAGDIERADAMGAQAANKLAQVVRLSENVIPFNWRLG